MMSTIVPIRRQIIVPAAATRAFEVFTSEMTRWWPSAHHIGQAPIEEIVIEPREGGRWYTRHADGSETSTGYVAAWDPPRGVTLTWQITADWKYDPRLVTTVEVRFVEEAPNRTRVELEHRDLENFGPEAERMRATFSSPGAWEGTLVAYASAFEGGQGPDPKYVLLYESADDVLTRAREHLPAHQARLAEFHARGDLLMVGPFGDPQGQGSMAVFRTLEAAQEFVADDPFVVHGVVRGHEIRTWFEVFVDVGAPAPAA